MEHSQDDMSPLQSCCNRIAGRGIRRLPQEVHIFFTPLNCVYYSISDLIWNLKTFIECQLNCMTFIWPFNCSPLQLRLSG